MALLTWSNEYSVEIKSIDRQHQKLFAMLNELHDAMKAGEGSHVAPAILKRLVAYTREHFSDEEGMMSRAHYPNLASHKVLHDTLTAEVVNLVRDFEAGKILLSMTLIDFLQNWLQSHILGCDKKYTLDLQNAGIR